MIASKYFDQIAITLSAVCIVHCLAVPLVIAVLPIAAVSLGDPTHFHGLMLWLVVPTSVLGFGLGFRVHGSRAIVGFGAVSVAVLAAAAVWGHSRWPEAVEIAVSVLGSLSLGAAHWWNFHEVRRLHRHGSPFSVPGE